MHNLQKIREILEVSQQWLAQESGVSLQNIKDIESGNKVYKTNYTIADALAGALGVKVGEIFQEHEISYIGRTAHTGKPLARRTVTLPMVIHHSCRLETYAGTGMCVNCEQPLSASEMVA